MSLLRKLVLSGTIILIMLPGTGYGETFTNPIGGGADPWVVFWNGEYYLCQSNGNCIIRKAEKLQDVAQSPNIIVWSPPADGPYSREIWAPELHYLQGKWYIYVAADDGQNANHRMYVLEGTTQNPQDPFVLKGKMSAATDCWAIDGTVLSLNNDTELYFIWSGWEGTVNDAQHLYIARMDNPWTISGERVLISSPTYNWEKLGSGGGLPTINEGPTAMIHGDNIFIIYSASGSWCDDYCLGQLRYMGGDFLSKDSWYKKPEPVFAKTGTVFGPGHASFVKSPDGTEDWIVYHAARYSGSGWDRNVRIQPFTWNENGSPNFGTPVSEGVLLEEPSNNVTSLEFIRQNRFSDFVADRNDYSAGIDVYSLLGRKVSRKDMRNSRGLYIKLSPKGYDLSSKMR